MKQHFATLGKQTVVYGLSAATLQAVGLVTLPVFARAFSPAEYGALEIATVGLSAMVVLSDLGLASASQRSYFDYTEEQREERKAVLFTAIITAVGFALAIAATLILAREPIAEWLFEGQLYTGLVVLVAVSIPLTVLATFCREVMRLRFRAWHYATSASLGAIVTGGLGVGLVVWADAGLNGVLYGVAAGNVVGVVYGLAVTSRDIGTRVSRPELRTMLEFGLPIIPAAAALWGLSFLDRLMLSRLASLDEVGQYAVGGRFALVLMFVVTAFGLAYSPFILSIWQQDKELEKQVRSRILTYLTVVLTFLALVISLFARELATVIAPGFDEAYEVVGILCIGVALFGVSSITMTGISLVRRTRLFALYTSTAVVVNVALNLALIPPLGGFGAATATATAFGLLAALYYWKSQELYPTPYEPRKAIVVLVTGAALMPLAFLPLGVASVAIKLAAVGAFVAALFVLRVLDAPEIAELRRIARRFGARPADSAAGP